MDRFADMEIFASVVESGGIGAAADRLSLAKSAVSRRLADLEARLGVSLLQRTTRRMHLTETGRTYYERCRQILADVDEAEQAVSQAHGTLSGTLKVALPLSFGLLQLAPLIDAFMARHPGLTIHLDFNDRQVDLIQEGIDVAIRVAQLAESSLVARRLALIRHCVCASPRYLEAHGVPAHPEELARHACLVYGNPSNPDIWNYRDEQGRESTVRVPVRLRANNGDMLVRAAVSGHGIVMVPTFLVHEALAAGSLVTLLENHAWPQLNAYAVYPHTRHLSTRVRAFVDFMAEALAGTPPWDRAD